MVVRTDGVLESLDRVAGRRYARESRPGHGTLDGELGVMTKKPL
jgi:hypothetical protein